ncbi:Uma2 family endonuclease [Pallidibacillus pasinlerensis]|uniref:Uma2 family endonuclease n=1 Tax=Pallidibacillus pasinlerensis TaxID=2703818 RepID=A0ABW9ZZW3_9BACI|nr:Uma2 family endonuclease [Pallidibacillus pasinlerensis]NCU16693.1 Uma2 family endonuclease [Pallidibacillus pasinlerensis]
MKIKNNEQQSAVRNVHIRYKSKLDEKGCNGSPDLIVEILSPSTAKMDKILKRNLYEEAGVKEYWIVDIQNELVEVNF